MLVAALGMSAYIMMQPELNFTLVLILLAISLVYGVTFVTPIGGGDMPVVISLLNSFTGIAAAGAGLIYGNQVMIVGGIIVGAAGTILTVLMCNAMNRSLLNVVIGGFGGGGSSSGSGREEIVKEATHADLAIQLKYSNKVIVVPGYGLAVAQAQHKLRELCDNLESRGVTVKYVVHPVAGRMPGEEWVNPLGTVFCWCPGEAGDGLWLGKYEVTRREIMTDLPGRQRPQRHRREGRPEGRRADVGELAGDGNAHGSGQ